MLFRGEDIRDPRVALGLLHQVPVHFMSFKSSVGELYEDGWKLHVDMQCEAIMGGQQLSLWFSHEHLKLAGKSLIDMGMSLEELRRYPIRITSVAPSNYINISVQGKLDFNFKSLEPNDIVNIDYGETKTLKLRDLLIPEEPPELIVDPNDIQDMMSRILDLQRPKQNEMRERYLEQESKGMKTTQAKIITFNKVA